MIQLSKLLKDAKDKKSVDLLNTASDLKNVYVITLADEKMMTFVHALPSTSYVPFFEVRRYRNGLLLRFPHPNFPDQIPPYEEQKYCMMLSLRKHNGRSY